MGRFCAVFAPRRWIVYYILHMSTPEEEAVSNAEHPGIGDVEEHEGGIQPGPEFASSVEAAFRAEQSAEGEQGVETPEDGPPYADDMIPASELEAMPEADREAVMVRVEALEAEHSDAREAIQAEAAGERLTLLGNVMNALETVAKTGIEGAEKSLDLAGRGVMATLEFLDLDSAEKGVEFVFELIPFVGLGYAVLGKRLKIEVDKKTGERSLSFEEISNLDRVLYAAWEFYGSGHIAKGIKEAVKKKGAKLFAKEAAELLARRAGENLLHRAKKGVQREIGIDLDAKSAK